MIWTSEEEPEQGENNDKENKYCTDCLVGNNINGTVNMGIDHNNRITDNGCNDEPRTVKLGQSYW